MNKILIDEETLKQVLETLLWANEEIKEWKDEAHGYSPVDEPVIMAAIAALHKTRAEQPAPYCTERVANELRRLHEENQEMLEALKAIIEDIYSEHGTGYEYAKARAVVDKGEQK